MSQSLADIERDKYTRTWRNDAYRRSSPGLRHLADAMDWMQPEAGAAITDWGSGSGKASDAMLARGFTVRMVDIAPNAYGGDPPCEFVQACLWDLPADMPATPYGFCADVMEHIPTEHVDDVFAGIAKRTTRSCYFQIALFDDRTFTKEGPLHLSVFPAEWWQARIEKHFKRVQYRKIRLIHLLALAEV